MWGDYLLSRGGAEVLVPFQQAFAEHRLVARRLHPGKRHFTLDKPKRKVLLD